MSNVPYSSYHGRKRHFRSILIGVAAALVVLLAAVLAGYYFGWFNLPDQPGGASGTPSDTPTASDSPTQDPMIIIEGPTAPPSPSLAPVEVDLSACVIRDIPLGLMPADLNALPETSRHGVLLDMTEVEILKVDPAWIDVPDPDTTRVGPGLADTLAGYPYAAAWLAPHWEDVGEDTFADTLTDRCVALAALGFDEIVFSAADPATVDGDALAGVYTAVREALTDAGWKGRLGLDVDQNWFKADSDAIIPAIAGSFERLYFRKTLTDGNKKALTDGGFVANGRTIVTYTKSEANLNYAWAVLP